MTTLRHFLVVQAFAVWQGGFVFYSAVVVPTGTDVLGSAALQGEITQAVTNWLNLIGVVWAAAFLWDLLADRDPSRFRRRLRWVGWGLAVGLLAALAVLHLKLDGLIGDDGRPTDRRAFLWWHGVYLWASTVQWADALLLAWLTVRAWQAGVTSPPAPLSEAGLCSSTPKRNAVTFQGRGFRFSVPGCGGSMSRRTRKLAGDVAAFIRQYRRKAVPNHDPNDRGYDRELEAKLKRMSVEELDELLREGGGEDEPSRRPGTE